MNNQYAAPQKYALMEINYNMSAVGTCRANRKGFDLEQVILDKNVIE